MHINASTWPARTFPVWSWTWPMNVTSLIIIWRCQILETWQYCSCTTSAQASCFGACSFVCLYATSKHGSEIPFPKTSFGVANATHTVTKLLDIDAPLSMLLRHAVKTVTYCWLVIGLASLVFLVHSFLNSILPVLIAFLFPVAASFPVLWHLSCVKLC